MEGRVGAGFVVFHNGNRIYTYSARLSDTATVFQAEEHTMYAAADYLIAMTLEIGVRYVKILSDSQAAITAIVSPQIKSKKVLDAVDSLESLSTRTKKVTLAWIKAHVGIEGNEEADKAAKKAPGQRT